MKKGDYVRRVTKYGNVVGPYMQVQVVQGRDNVVYCDTVGLDEPNVKYYKPNLKVISHMSLCVSENVIQNLKSGRQSVVSHPASEMWLHTNDIQPTLVTFYCRPKGYRITVVVDRVYKYTRGRETTVKISVLYVLIVHKL